MLRLGEVTKGVSGFYVKQNFANGGNASVIAGEVRRCDQIAPDKALINGRDHGQ